MADPQHTPEMDPLDRLTVRLYRLGLAVAAGGLGLLSAALVLGEPTRLRTAGELGVVAGAAAAVADMHLYDKRIRWVIGAAAWLGAVLLVAAPGLPSPAAHWVHHAGLGFVFVSLSAFAIKEQFCFKIPALRTVPAFLALSLIPLVGHFDVAGGLVLAPAALIYAAMALAKARMPLHFDIGNKSAYQV